MPGKKLLWLVLAIGFLSSNGCCAMWDRWCDRPRCYQPAPAPQCGCAPVQSAPVCPQPSYYNPPPPVQSMPAANVQAVPQAQGNWGPPPQGR